MEDLLYVIPANSDKEEVLEVFGFEQDPTYDAVSIQVSYTDAISHCNKREVKNQ